ncbi:hypothetical protein ACW0TQ_17015 [Oceanobacillus sp. M60]
MYITAAADRFAFRRPGPAITRPIENFCTSESGVVGRSGAMHHHQFQKSRIFNQNASMVMENMLILE